MESTIQEQFKKQKEKACDSIMRAIKNLEHETGVDVTGCELKFFNTYSSGKRNTTCLLDIIFKTSMEDDNNRI